MVLLLHLYMVLVVKEVILVVWMVLETVLQLQMVIMEQMEELVEAAVEQA